MPRSSMSTTHSAAVLLVQHSRDDGLEMYAEFLRYHGLAPIAVSSARDALTIAPVADVIVTGILLDDQIDGIELVSRLRRGQSTMDTPIIVLTACAWPRERERAAQAAATCSCRSRASRMTCCAKCGGC